MNKTEMLLFVKYETPAIPLERICEEYFGCAKGTAKQRAKAGTLPIPAFRLGSSQKLPWMVKISDLAAFIDKTHEEAKKEWVGGI
ncbi:MAG: pyocin activator PrtN family protein [Alphaproteobacteria bacterium]|nr:pyocin activator PrtN family protein [Alphaproteobacteria bacterium]